MSAAEPQAKAFGTNASTTIRDRVISRADNEQVFRLSTYGKNRQPVQKARFRFTIE
jgi:hypothetical protein